MHHVADRLPGPDHRGLGPSARTPRHLWCGHVFANLARQAQFGELIRHRERTAGARLDAVQSVPDGVRVNMELGSGIGERALVGTPRPEGVEEDIYFFAAQVIELAEDDGCTFFVTSGALTAATASTESSNAVTPPFLMLRAFNATRAKRRLARYQ